MKPAAGLANVEKSPNLKLATRGDVFERLEEIYDDIARRAFEIFESGGRVFGRDLDNWLRAESEVLQPAKIDITDLSAAFRVHAEAPGFKLEELEVTAEPWSLTITGKHETKDERTDKKLVYSERQANHVLRVIEFPEPVICDKVTATLKDGVLELELPKAEPSKKIQIEPKAA